jgi:hypothetical protein
VLGHAAAAEEAWPEARFGAVAWAGHSWGDDDGVTLLGGARLGKQCAEGEDVMRLVRLCFLSLSSCVLFVVCLLLPLCLRIASPFLCTHPSCPTAAGPSRLASLARLTRLTRLTLPALQDLDALRALPVFNTTYRGSRARVPRRRRAASARTATSSPRLTSR